MCRGLTQQPITSTCQDESGVPLQDPNASGWGVSTPEEKAAAVKRAAVCLLGHLYAGARLELLHLGHALGLSAHCEVPAPLPAPLVQSPVRADKSLSSPQKCCICHLHLVCDRVTKGDHALSL